LGLYNLASVWDEKDEFPLKTFEVIKTFEKFGALVFAGIVVKDDVWVGSLTALY
jgi:hypothetical protein